MKYIVKLGWSITDKYEFDSNSAQTAITFAEIAAEHRMNPENKEITIEIVKEDEDEDW